MAKYHNHTDHELTHLLRTGDENAFAEIYNRYWKKMFYIAANNLDYLEEAEEMVQDIFVSLWERKEKLDIRTSLSNYLSISVKYRIINFLSKQSSLKKYIDSLVITDLIDNSTQELLDFEELKSELAKYVQQLPEKCRLVFALSRDLGYTQKEIAAELKISEKTVEAHLGKAFKILRTKLTAFFFTLL